MFHQRGNRSSRHLLILRTRPSQMSWISVDFAVDFLVEERVLSTRKSYAFPNDLQWSSSGQVLWSTTCVFSVRGICMFLAK